MNLRFSQYRLSKESSYGAALTIVGSGIWFLVLLNILLQKNAIAGIFGLGIDGVFLWVFFRFMAALFRARMFGNSIALTKEQFPELYDIFVDASQQLGLKKTPEAFIYNSHGVMNAVAVMFARGRYVLLTSAIVEIEEHEQLRFIIGHELAHHALGHLGFFKHVLRLPGCLVPFLYSAYSRAREFSCDAVGAALLEDKIHALTALQMLACGARRLNSGLNPRAFAAQERHVPRIAGFCREIMMTHPRTTRRVERLMTVFSFD
ncbi:hypothetical protein JCM15831A_10180 [Asaia astilbis]